MKKTITAALCALLTLVMIPALAGCGAAAAVSAPAAAEAQITVSASSTVRLTPDKASVFFGVTTQETSADEAQKKNGEAVARVIATLTERGVEEKSIRTVDYGLYPQYDWSEDDGQRIIGYNATTSLSVEDQDIEDLGKLLSACVAAGINRVDYVSFLCSGYDEAYRQALAQAVALSHDKAAALAAAAGKKLGDPLSVTEGWHDTSARYAKNAEVPTAVMEQAMDAAGPIFQPGESEITASVTVCYGMK
ncbi:MAG: SIMPL domain-containing protein [Oscillospiraceae bacterium]|nr:SIMPL domain-containing protein [Oscillospiraceae bacterium]